MRNGLLYGADELVAKWVQRRCGGIIVPPGSKAIGYFENGGICAGAMFYHHRLRDITMALAVAEPMPLTLGFLPAFRKVMEYPFNELGLQRVSAEIEESNQRCLRLALGYGAEVEGIKRGAAEDGGDIICVAVYRGRGLGAAHRRKQALFQEGRPVLDIRSGPPARGSLGDNAALVLLPVA